MNIKNVNNKLLQKKHYLYQNVKFSIFHVNASFIEYIRKFDVTFCNIYVTFHLTQM